MFLSAVKYQTGGDHGRAKALYLAIMDKYKDDELSIKAGERLAGLSDVETKEASDRATVNAASESAAQTQSKIDQANRDAADRSYPG